MPRKTYDGMVMEQDSEDPSHWRRQPVESDLHVYCKIQEEIDMLIIFIKVQKLELEELEELERGWTMIPGYFCCDTHLIRF